MKNQKNIDELFRERFKQAEVTPPPSAWANIADRLPEKKNKRLVAPIWYRIAGVAALLLLVSGLAFQYFKPSRNIHVVLESVNPDIRFYNDKIFESFQEQLSSSGILLDELIQKSGNMAQGKNNLVEKKNQLVAEAEKDSGEKVLAEAVNDHSRTNLPEAVQIPEATFADSAEEFKNVKNKETLEALALSEEASPGEEVFEKTKTTKESSSRISVSTRIAPLFGESASNVSSNPSYSYGVSVAYGISENISLRTGINNMDLGYANSGVAFVAQPAGITEAGNINLLATPEASETEHRANFLEVPLEMKYALINKKINLNLIGGGSLLFLNSSKMPLPAPNFVRRLEQPQQPEDFGITTNVGIGLGYELLNQLEVYMEPMVKVRLGNPDSTLSPYYFGLYSGFSYRF